MKMNIFRIDFFITLLFPSVLVAVKYCSNTPPFLNRLQEGVDITKLDLLPLNSAKNDGGFKGVVFDFTCDHGVKQRINNIEYNIPDQIWSIVNIPSGWIQSTVEIYKTTHSLKDAMALSAGVDITWDSGAFSASTSYQRFQSYLTNSSKYIEDVISYTSGYKVNIIPSWELQSGRGINSYIEMFLPSKINSSNVAKYMEFIKNFGTHYFKQGKFGGLLRLVLATDQNYFYRKSSSYVELQASLTYKTIHVETKHSSGKEKIDADFKKATHEEFKYFGGQANLFSSGGMSAWQPTVLSNPWLYGGSLTEIYRLIQDPVIRESVKRAVQIYMDKAYLEELLRTINWYRGNGKWRQHMDILNSFQNEVKKMLNDSMPDHKKVNELRDISKFVQYLNDQFY